MSAADPERRPRTPFVLSEDAKRVIAEAPPLGETQIGQLSRIFAGASARIRAGHGERARGSTEAA